MGIIACCAPSKTYVSKNMHIYQINRYYCEDSSSHIFQKMQSSDNSGTRYGSEMLITPMSSRDSSIVRNTRLNTEISNRETQNNNLDSSDNSKKKQTLKNKKGTFQLFSYDVEQEESIKLKIIFPIIKSIEGLSELTIKSNFYLCGIPPKQLDEGSYLFKANLEHAFEDSEINAQILINSQQSHVYPALISDKNSQIFCVGGKGQIQCELYNCSLNKWYTLPKLPEERYKCTLCLDSKEEYIYLFGGINVKEKNNNENIDRKAEYSVLRLNINKQLVWEKLIIKNDPKNLTINRFSSGSFNFKNDEDFIFIIGGEDSNKNCLDDVIRFSIKNLKFEPTGIKLHSKAKFINQYGILNDEQTYVFIDSLNERHTVDRHDCLPLDYHPTEI
jgi:hypothetical protein